MNGERTLAYIATFSVLLALSAFMISTMHQKGQNMVAYKTDKDIRVVCYLPDEVNRKLQAHASLEGVSKQTLTRDILVAWVEKQDTKAPAKSPTKKQAVKEPVTE